MSFQVYFDMSGGWKNVPWLTLAGIGAEDDVWAEVNERWRAILDSHPLKPKYIHMSEAIPLTKEFSPHKGWSDAKVAELVGHFIELLSLQDKKRIKMFFRALNMNVYRKLQSAGFAMDSAIDICSHCCDNALSWLFLHWPGVIHSANYFFDEEVFKDQFEAKWTQKTNQLVDPGAEREIWGLIKGVAMVGKKEDHPPIQAADVLAWSVNRFVTAETNVPRPWNLTVEVMVKTIPAIGSVWGEAQLLGRYGTANPRVEKEGAEKKSKESRL